MVVRIENLNIRVALDIARSHFAGTGNVDHDGLRDRISVKLGSNALYVKNDLADVLFNTGYGGDLVENSVNSDVRYRNAEAS